MERIVQNPIVVQNISKSYEGIPAVTDISFEVCAGAIFGLIGPDGAGKTTLMRMIVSLIRPDKGTVYFEGRDVTLDDHYVRTHVGYMPQRFSLYQDLSVDENLTFFSDLFKLSKDVQKKRKEDLYDFSRLGPFKNRLAGSLSGGMKQKLALSCMLVHQPRVIVLDEPTYGVDPVSRSEFWHILQGLAKQGTTILMTTAYMDEANLCDRVALIYEGKILAMNEPAKLLKEFRKSVFIIVTEGSHVLFSKMRQSRDWGKSYLFGDGIHLVCDKSIRTDDIKNRLESIDSSYLSVRKTDPNLEDLFLDLMDETSKNKSSSSGSSKRHSSS